jgi:hypothetical protein
MINRDHNGYAGITNAWPMALSPTAATTSHLAS